MMTGEQLQAQFEQGAALQRLGKLAEAAACYKAVLAEAPQVAQVHYNLGLALQGQGLHAAAGESFRNAVGLRPDWAEALVNLALALQKQRRFAEAEQCSRRALRLKPDLPEALMALGSVLRDLGRFEAAITRLSEAVRRFPQEVSIRNNLGLALKQMGRLAEAEAVFRAALTLQPENPALRYNLGELDLVAGRLVEGWEGFEYRWRLEGQTPPTLATPLWDGRTLRDGRLLLYTEQGLGDTIQFCRYVRLAAERARVVLVVRPETRRLLADLHPGVPVALESEGAPDHLVQCSLPSLPRIFGTTLETIPGPAPYLHAHPGVAARWRDRLASLPGLRVGLVWAGNPQHVYDHLRSVPLGQLARVLSVPGVSFVSLQKGATAAQMRALPAGVRLHDWTAELADLADTAALTESLDLVIGVDTSVVHLAGALGKPVWLLNRFDTDWRWLLGRDDSPWYPTLRQFRQRQPGDWKGVVTRVAEALAERVKTG